MKTLSIVILFIFTLVVAGCGEKNVEPTVEAPPSNSSNVEGLSAPISGQGTATRGGG